MRTSLLRALLVGLAALFLGCGPASLAAQQTTPALTPCPGGAAACRSAPLVSLMQVMRSRSAGQPARGPAAPSGGTMQTQAMTASALSVDPLAPVVSVAEVNPGGTHHRANCLSVAAGGGAAIQCGDYVVGHALPATRVLGRTVQPALLYASQTAHPHPVFNVRVTVPASAWPLDSLTTVLWSGGTRLGGSSFAAAQFPADQARQLSLELDQPDAQSALYRYTLEVRAWHGASFSAASAPVELTVVNRSQSPFGAGWWPAGVEVLVNGPANELVRVDADGSSTVYRMVPGAEWVRWAADPVERPDTLVYVSGEYVQKYPGGTRVYFDSWGRQVRSVTRTGLQSDVQWSGYVPTRLTLPHGGGIDTGYGYDFRFWNAGFLDRVTAPGGRQTVTWMAGPQLTQIDDPDGAHRYFAYAGPLGRMSRLIDARGSWTQLSYGAGARAAGGRRLGGGSVSTADDVVNTYWDPQAWSLAHGTVDAGFWSALLDGPRVDVGDTTRVWLDGRMQPTRVRDALGSETTVTRDDPRFPALATRVDAPGATFNGGATRMVSTATYTARGNVLTTTVQNPLGDGQNPTTTYEYTDPVWQDFATKVTSPTGLVSTTGYDATTGNRRWEQVGTSTTRRVNYGYNLRGQVDTVWSAAAQLRGEPPEVIDYNSPLGNLSAVESPLHIRTEYLEDALGRVIRTRSPMEGGGFASDSTAYDAAGRVADSYSYGPPVPYERVSDGAPRTTVPLLLRVHNTYDPASLPLRVQRWSVPDSAGIDTVSTGWHYDPLGRQVAEIAPDGAVDSVVYNLAGNVIQSINRKREEIRTRYDALGRPTSQVISGDLSVTPAVPGDSSTFAYDGSGAMVRADNDVARVRRHYFPGGALRTDTLWVAGETGFASGLHVYVQGYTYDREGRRRTHELPANLIPIASPRIQYGYDLVTGALDTITDPLSNRYRFAYTADGQLDTLSLPGGIAETYHRDADGRMTRRFRGTLYDDSLAYDVRGKTVRAITGAETASMAYDGLGHLVWSHTHHAMQYRDDPDTEEEYGSDALGNTTSRRQTGLSPYVGIPTLGIPTKHTYQARTGRHVSSLAPAPGYTVNSIADSRVEIFGYDAAGNLTGSSVQQGLVVHNSASGGPGWVSFSYEHSDTTPNRRNNGWGTWMDTASITSVPNPRARDATQLVNNRYTYRADGKLVVFVREGECLRFEQNGACASQYPAYTSQNRTERYRYDALGRRVLVRTTTPTGSVLTGQALCDDGLHRCDNTTRRTIWDGDQILAETRYPNAQPEQDSGLDSLNVAERNRRDNIAETDQGHPYGGHNTSWWAPHGRVLYVHGGGMDQPLGLIRSDYSYDFSDPVLIVPHANWRGAYETSTFVDGNTDRCKTVWLPSSEVVRRDSTGRVYTLPLDAPDTTQARCIERDFPGAYMGMTRLLKRQTVYGPIAWQGSLVMDGSDASGLSYRRNRYYDPSTGRFTQEDPIGIAGGLNVYGFAGGDPVNYSDPYGLTCMDWAQWANGECLEEIRRGLAAGIAAGAERARAVVRQFNRAAGTIAFLGITEGAGEVVEIGAVLEEAGFAQRTYSEAFSIDGTFAGRTIDDVAAALKSGELRTADLPVEYVEREGSRLIVNTRSAQALERAGIPRSEWRAINKTYDAATQARVARQLGRNRLTNAGTKVVTSSGK